MACVHGTCVAIDGQGVLIVGPPGSGKSDLALRLIERGAKLVADDYVELLSADDMLRAEAPQRIAGLIEVRGLGLARLESVAGTPVALVAELAGPDSLERLPEPYMHKIAGKLIPACRIAPFEASAPIKLRLALEAATGKIELLTAETG